MVFANLDERLPILAGDAMHELNGDLRVIVELAEIGFVDRETTALGKYRVVNVLGVIEPGYDLELFDSPDGNVLSPKTAQIVERPINHDYLLVYATETVLDGDFRVPRSAECLRTQPISNLGTYRSVEQY